MDVITSGGCMAVCEPSLGSLACCNPLAQPLTAPLRESIRLPAGLQVTSQDAQGASEVPAGAATHALT